MKRRATFPMAFVAAASAMLVVGMPLRAVETDDNFESSFRKTYVYRTYLKDDVIRAEIKNGVATLTGTVDDESRKELAQDTVASLPGVTRVINQLAIRSPGAAERSDAWILKRVVFTLQFYRSVNTAQTTVEVKDGIVTLRGHAWSEAQREMTAEYAKDIEGVQEVKNEMTVEAAPEVAERTARDYSALDDASITGQIMTVLMTHRSTRPINARVMTRDGEVTLTGIAKTAAEKALVARIAADVYGVKSVKNQMTIMPAEASGNR